MVEEDKTYENEISKPKKDTKCCGEHGGKRSGAGRPFGAKTKKLWKSMEEMAVKYQHSPLDYLLSVLNNPASAPERKMYAAEKAAPYVHSKLATTVTKLGSDGPIKINIKWGDE